MIGPGFAQKVIEEVNKIRLNPKTYSNKIRGYLSCFQGNVLRIPKQPGLMTTEGPTAYREAADFLLSLPKLQPLALDNSLNSAAQDMAEELVQYAVDKGTPVLESSAEAVRQKAIDVTKEVLKKLEKEEK